MTTAQALQAIARDLVREMRSLGIEPHPLTVRLAETGTLKGGAK